jgi:hypothetical protein
MADDLSKRGKPDQTRINVNERWEVEWWTKHLGVSEVQLRNAVKTVGPMVANVKRHLGR